MYEYKTVPSNVFYGRMYGWEEKMNATLDKYGADGWELVAIDNGFFFFKRKIGE